MKQILIALLLLLASIAGINAADVPSQSYDQLVQQRLREGIDAIARSPVMSSKKPNIGVDIWKALLVTLGPTAPGAVHNEGTPRITDRYFNDYEQTKSIAEKEAVARAAAGFSVVIVNPSRVYGPGHLTEGNSVARLVDQYDRRQVPVLLNLGRNVGNWVYIDDAVQGHLLAMEKGRIGQRDLLGGENASLKQFFRLIDEISGKRHLQVPVLHFSALAFSWLQLKRAEWFNVYPQITPGWVRMFLAEWAFSSEKSERELGYRPTPLAVGLRRSYEWLKRVRSESS